MKRSALVDGLLFSAVAASMMSLVVLLRAVPEECPAPEAAMGEQAATPCLAASRDDFDRPTLPFAQRPDFRPTLPALSPIAPEIRRMGERRQDDVETTGSVGEPAR